MMEVMSSRIDGIENIQFVFDSYLKQTTASTLAEKKKENFMWWSSTIFGGKEWFTEIRWGRTRMSDGERSGDPTEATTPETIE